MIYKEQFHPKIKSDLKKIDKSVVKKIKEIYLNEILENPYKAEKLNGRLSAIYSYHFRANRVEYRIAYKILEEDTILFYYMIAKRENFYKYLETRNF